MEYTLIKSKRKSIAIIIRDGEVIVRAPLFSSQESIDAFVTDKQEWIINKLSEYRPIGIQTESKYAYVLGKYKKIEYCDSPTWSVENKEEIVVSAPRKSSKQAKARYLEDYLKKELMGILEESIAYYSSKLQISIPPFKVRKYKRLHGRCSSKGELAFNTYLYEHSVEFIHYVVLHECAHLIEFNHSKSFYNLIEAFMPNYKEVIAQDKKLLSLHQGR